MAYNIDSMRSGGPDRRALPDVLEVDKWDPFGHHDGSSSTWSDQTKIYLIQAGDEETDRERQVRFLTQVSRACFACTMCGLGLKHAEVDGIERDPHMPGNVNPSRVMVVGRNPCWEDLRLGGTLSGPAGVRFDEEVARHGLSRSDFYVCNAVKCWTGGAAPTATQVASCSPFLAMEINILRPRLVAALGPDAWGALVSGVSFRTGLERRVVRSPKYDVPVLAMCDPLDRDFAAQARTLCAMTRRINV